MNKLPPRNGSLRPWWLLCWLVFCLVSLAPLLVATAVPAERSLSKIPILQPGGQAAGKSGGANVVPRQWAERQSTVLQRRLEITRLLGERSVSRKSHELLRQRRLGPALLETGSANWKAPPVELPVDTLRILVIRIGFETDRSGDLTAVTTDGNFQLGEAGELDFIEPSPHDRNFFESHLFGLSEYYRLQSGGRLFIEGAVLPSGRNDCYKLSDMADYGPGAGGGWLLADLERLVKDMISLADSSMTADEPEFSMSDYDFDDPFSYVIFVHAGSDWQSDVNANSPNDIPTFFVTLGDSVPLVSVDHETLEHGYLRECSVIPESTTQDGYFGSISAALYHEFGHALGLVDVYSTATGFPQVGFWDLMDSGTNASANIGFLHPTEPETLFYTVTGLLPPSLGAWSKWFLGWLEVAELQNRDETFKLPAVQVPRNDQEYQRYRNAGYPDFYIGNPQGYIAGASPREFFLLENRWVPTDATELTERTGVGYVRDDSTGVILYLGGDIDSETGEPRNLGMYDFFLPTIPQDSELNHTGLLVWHVNMDRIEANLATNTINYWEDGLRLVEPDGMQDIGVYDAFTFGFFGSYLDPYNELNGDAIYVEGAPSSRAYDRSWTGLELSDIHGYGGNLRPVILFEASISPLTTGTPLTMDPLSTTEAEAMSGVAGPRAMDASSLTPFTLDNGGSLESAIVFADQPGSNWGGDTYQSKLFVFAADGLPSLNANQPGWPFGAAWQLTAPLAGPPVVLNHSGNAVPTGQQSLVVGCSDGVVLSFAQIVAAGPNLQTVWGPITVGASLAHAPAPDAEAFLLCTVNPDSLVLLAPTGEILGDPLVLADSNKAPVTGYLAPPLPISLNQNGGSATWVVFTPTGWFLVERENDVLLADPIFQEYSAGPITTLRRAFIELSSESGHLLLFGDDGMQECWLVSADESPTPVVWPYGELETVITEPAVADLSGDGHNDLIVATARRVHAFQVAGPALTGFPVQLYELFPLADSTRFAGPLVVCDGSGDGTNEIYCQTDRGHLVGLDGRGVRLERTPLLWGEGERFGMCVGPSESGPDRIMWQLDAGGRTGPPFDRQWHNGLLVGYGLPASESTPERSSEWLGAAGGGFRLGAVGQPRTVVAMSPWRRDSYSEVVYYPNPLSSDRMTVRFFSFTDQAAELAIYNLEGEVVTRATIATTGNQINEYEVELPGLASGLYVCKLEYESANGIKQTISSLAVEK
ncbi:MAG: T9SS type A sorting domain-containing protein [bacterium]